MDNYPIWFGSQVDKAIVSGAMIEGSIPSRIARIPCDPYGCRVFILTGLKMSHLLFNNCFDGCMNSLVPIFI